ncbi:MAG: type II toxin-antitoxin system RelE/ParE family toxin [Thermoplasmata archaeon]|nr:type II toxin-antitoxin system RelE/ParE family toxin [Thermoplasmata archaeon]
MVEIVYDDGFAKQIKKIKDQKLKERVKKQIRKIIENPEIGKPMRFARQGTREVRIKPFRLSYIYLKNEDKIVFLDLYHKDEQ